VPGFGKVFYSSDAATVTCWSRTTGLTCKHYNGVSFWIGRTRGYRIFYDAPGFVPHVRPLFRTSFGVRCGIELDNLEPANPVLLCWHPSDGLQLTIAHDRAGYGGQHSRAERRPRATCRRGSRYSEAAGRSVGGKVDRSFAEHCSPSSGTPIFTCKNSTGKLTCVNQARRGFWVDTRSFYTF
jgi:hypothetical protein